ncbi:hypothetical protein PMIT1306_02108 [Prochlorococcus sp. MIT 1306]|nr:hypothetical protein PMIT1306_02108 [Prochlorococcus sp. MIT 1306]
MKFWLVTLSPVAKSTCNLEPMDITLVQLLILNYQAELIPTN